MMMKSIFSPGVEQTWMFFPELVKSLILVEELDLNIIKTTLVHELYKCIVHGVIDSKK